MKNLNETDWTDTRKQRLAAFNAGKQAFTLKKPITDVPNDPSFRFKQEWQDGWKTAAGQPVTPVFIKENSKEPEYDQEGGDITTEDGNTWYQYGKLYHTGDKASLKRKIDKDQFWPNIFQVSDHGNFHQITLNESLKDIENWLNESVSPNEDLNRKFQEVELRLSDKGNPYNRWEVKLVPNEGVIRVWADSVRDIPGIGRNEESADVMARILGELLNGFGLVVANKGVSFGTHPNVYVDLKIGNESSAPKQPLNEEVVWNRPLTVKGKAVKINMEAIGDIIRGEQDKRKSKKLINLRDAMNVVTAQPQPKSLLEENTMGTNPFKVGDTVKLRPDVLLRHAKSVPAHMGYTTNQFSWRDTLGKLDEKIGKIDRLFPNSKHVNVRFPDGKLIGIDYTELVPVLPKI